MDLGKHNYTIIPRSAATGFRVLLNALDCDNEADYQRLSARMLENKIVMDEVVALQRLLDERVRYLLQQPPEVLFNVTSIEKEAQLPEVPSVYLTCCRCGEQVLSSHAVARQDEIWCLSCLHRMTSGSCRHRLH